MSRAYRVKISETLRRVLRAEDHVGTRLELLPILSEEQMAELLEQELTVRGFTREGDVLVREQEGLRIEVDPMTGTVTVQAQAAEDIELDETRDARIYEEQDQKAAKAELKRRLCAELEQQADAEQDRLQKDVTERLEKELLDLRVELDQAVNRVTADALKIKAAQIGQIKQMTEDRESGSLTIVLEV